MIEIAEAINSFAPKTEQTNFVQPSEEPIFVLTGSQLQDLLGTIQSLKDEVDQLKGINPANLGTKVSSLEATQDTQGENELNLLRFINDLREANHKEPSADRSPLIDELYSHMKAVGLKQTTFTGAAKILGITRGRVHQLKTVIALDQRFIIVQSESHKQRLFIRLR